MVKIVIGSFVGFVLSAMFLGSCGAGSTASTAQVQADLAALQQALDDTNTLLENTIEDIAQDRALLFSLQSLLLHFSRTGDDVFITGANLHIRNGQGNTETSNSLGNLIVGYNEDLPPGNRRTGSHMVIVGRHHSWTQFGGIVVGEDCMSGGKYASVSGGKRNNARDPYSSISGGDNNQTSAEGSSILGGQNRLATVDYQTIP